MKLALTITFILFYFTVFSQVQKAKPEKWKTNQYDANVTLKQYDHNVSLTKIYFHVNDTVLDYTLIQEPSGSFYFKEGHQFTKDTVWFEYQMSHNYSKL